MGFQKNRPRPTASHTASPEGGGAAGGRPVLLVTGRGSVRMSAAEAVALARELDAAVAEAEREQVAVREAAWRLIPLSDLRLTPTVEEAVKPWLDPAGWTAGAVADRLAAGSTFGLGPRALADLRAAVAAVAPAAASA